MIYVMQNGSDHVFCREACSLDVIFHILWFQSPMNFVVIIKQKQNLYEFNIYSNIYFIYSVESWITEYRSPKLCTFFVTGWHGWRVTIQWRFKVHTCYMVSSWEIISNEWVAEGYFLQLPTSHRYGLRMIFASSFRLLIKLIWLGDSNEGKYV